MNKAPIATLLAFAVLPFYSTAGTPEPEWVAATDAMRSYCMAEICLGMSVDELSRIPGGTLKLWKSNQWTRNCTGTYANWALADFISKDGTKFLVGFRDFPGSAETNLRFRVQSVSVYFEATQSEFELLREKITSRYSMLHTGNSTFQEWSVTTPYFNAGVDASFKQIPGKSMLLLSAKVDRYQDWMREQPACKGRNPALPSI